MKIGILSMQKIHNYGSFLQALSLKMQLEARGHDVYFVDIQPGKQMVESPAAVSGGLLRKIDRYALKRVEHYLQFRKMAKLHIADQENFLQIGKVLPDGEKFDLVIIGSDEVFNATAASPWGFTEQLFGKVDNAKRVATYAASCGQTTYEAAEKYGILEAIRASMENLCGLSVRDQNTAEFVESITGKTPLQHLDPVFISDYDQYIPDAPKQKPYLLVYAYANRIKDEREIAAIQKYAKKNGLQTVSVGMYQRWCDRNVTASGFELLSYVKHAHAIVTDTFHGTVFSIKFNKQFVTMVRDSNSNKLCGLLNQFGLAGRVMKNPEEMSDIMGQPVDFVEVNQYIQQERMRTAEYLDSITKEDTL